MREDGGEEGDNVRDKGCSIDSVHSQLRKEIVHMYKPRHFDSQGEGDIRLGAE